jgi:hypothetical protein
VVQNVFLDDAAALAAAADLARVEVVLGDQLAYRRAQVGRGGGFRLRGRGLCCRGGGVGLGLGVEHGNDLFAGHLVALVLEDLDQYAVLWRGDVEHDLVGLDVNQVLVPGDGVAGLLVPVEEGSLRNRLWKHGHTDFDAHGSSLSFPTVGCLEQPGVGPGYSAVSNFPVSAFSTSACCCAACSAKLPAAGDAEALRPA